MALLIVCVLTNVLWPQDALRVASWILLLGYLALEWPRLPLHSRILLALGGLLVAPVMAGWWAGQSALAQGLDRGAFFATFFASLFFLAEAARTSSLIHRCGVFFVNQRPGRRYLLLTVGSYLIGMILNMGVITLLGTMVRRRNTLAQAGGIEAVRALREKRMMLAVLRGFAITPLASPLSLGYAVLLTAMPGLNWPKMLGLGALTSLAFLGVGWLVDRLTVRRQVAMLAPKVPPVVPERDLRPLLGLVAIVLCVLFLAIFIEEARGVRLSQAVLVSLPIIGGVWLTVQHARFGIARAPRLTARRLARRSRRALPAVRTEIAVLAGAAFIGTVVAAAVPPEALAHLLTTGWLPPLLLAPLASLIILALSMFGINPIVTLTILAPTLRSLPDLPVAPEVVALALMGGWSLAICGSPSTASSMLAADLIAKPSTTVAWRWNGSYTLLAFAVLMAEIFILSTLR